MHYHNFNVYTMTELMPKHNLSPLICSSCISSGHSIMYVQINTADDDVNSLNNRTLNTKNNAHNNKIYPRITLHTAQTIAASNLYCKITLVWLDSSLSVVSDVWQTGMTEPNTIVKRC